MIRKYSLVIEGDPTGYSAYVPELPAILVTGRSVEELADRAAEAIRIYWGAVRTSTKISCALMRRLIPPTLQE